MLDAIEYFDMLYFENCTLRNGIENNNENKKNQKKIEVQESKEKKERSSVRSIKYEERRRGY